MRLVDFIEAEREAILGQWDEFARTLKSAQRMDPAELRDHASRLLMQIVGDMRDGKSTVASKQKSRGSEDATEAGRPSAAQVHGGERLAGGFDIEEMAAEYRALRASVIRLWLRGDPDDCLGDEAVQDLVRFDEALDQALSESLVYFDKGLRRVRELFLGTLAHDVRGPLQAIIVSAQALQRGGSTEPAEQTARRMLASAHRIRQIVDDLLDALTVRLYGKLPIEPQDADAVALCGEVLDEMRTLHPRQAFAYEGPESVQGRWDPSTLQQAVANLLGNAVRYARAQSVVSLRIDADERELRIHVHNEGVPIPPAVQRAIFEPLVRAADQDAPTHRGLGLGLFITNSIASGHGGRVDLSSDAEQGTTFSLVLPRYVPAPAAAPDANAGPPPG